VIGGTLDLYAWGALVIEEVWVDASPLALTVNASLLGDTATLTGTRPVNATVTVSLHDAEGEGDPMPVNTLSGPVDVSCSTSAWTRLDVTPLANRAQVAVLNTSSVDYLGILLTGSDSTPSAGTPFYRLLTPDWDVYEPLPGLGPDIRVWGRSYSASGGPGSAAVIARVEQFAP
jgi:hypothetical protein